MELSPNCDCDEDIKVCVVCGNDEDLDPEAKRDRIIFERLGELTVIDERLHSREVPTITIEEIAEASKLARARGV